MVSSRELFDSNDPVEIVTKFDRYRDALNKSLSDPTGDISPDQRRVHNALKAVQDGPTINKAVRSDLAKAVSTDVVESLGREFSRNGGFLGKSGLDLAGPGSTGGLNVYDLEAPAKQIYPRNTPLRNRIARTKGFGTAHEFKRITAITGSSTGLDDFHPGITEKGTTPWGTLDLVRPKAIEITGDDVQVPYRMFGTSNSVTAMANWAGQGYENLRQLSTSTALWSAMLLEEKALLSSRGTASGFGGALAVPSAPVVTTPVASGSQAPVTGVATSAWALVVARTRFGSTPVGAVGTSTFTSGDVVNVTWTAVPGSEYYDVYLGGGSSAPALTAMYKVGDKVWGTSLVVTGALPTAAAAASTVTGTDTSATANGYDGLISILTNPALAGSVKNVGGPLTGDAPFQDLFATLYENTQADPETIYMAAGDRSALSDILKQSGSASYRIVLQNGVDVSMGALVTGISNQSTGRLVDLEVHPFMPRGTALVASWTLPVPNSNISNCFEVVNVQDYLAYEWPQIELRHDCSVVWHGTFCAYAPSYSGSVIFGPPA